MTPEKSMVLYTTRKIGEGIAHADTLDKVKYDELSIKAYTTHGFIEGLSSDISTGDCFLFNVMLYATERPPFNDVSVSSVVEYYFNFIMNDKKSDRVRIESMPSDLSISLDMAINDIFGKKNPMRQRVSDTFKKNKNIIVPNPKKGNVKLFIVLAISIYIIWLLS